MGILKVTIDGTAAIIEIGGEAVKAELSGLIDNLKNCAQRGATGFAIDMSKVDFIDSSGVGVLLEARNIAEKSFNARIILCEVPPDIYKVFDRLGIERVFQLAKTREKAIEKLKA